jgi:hypothetical protein
MPSKKLLEFIVTFGFIGKIKLSRGTLISLAAFLIMWFLPFFLGNPSPIESLFSDPWFFMLLFIFLPPFLFLLLLNLIFIAYCNKIVSFIITCFLAGLVFCFFASNGPTESIIFYYHEAIFFTTAATVLLFFVGLVSSSLYIKHYPTQLNLNEIVIDKVFGQMLTFILTFVAISQNVSKIIVISRNISKTISKNFPESGCLFVLMILLPVVLFQIFDAKKPWPAKWLNNNIKGALRIMLDGLLAAVFASMAFCGIFFSVLNFL